MHGARDTRGRRTSVTDGNNKVTTYAYDDADRLTSATDAANHVTRYGYDNESHLTSITDANNHTTSFSYWNGLLSQTTFPSTYYETYSYDNMNNLTYKTDRKGQGITYSYDNLDRLISKYIGRYLNYTYDNASHLTKVTDGSDTYQFAYDRIGRLTQTQSTYSFVGGRTFTVSYGRVARAPELDRTKLWVPRSSRRAFRRDGRERKILCRFQPLPAFGLSPFELLAVSC